MTFNNLMFIFWSLALSSGISYGFWVVLRVAKLRQDLFIIRDRLFDLAAGYNRLSDPAYLEFRASINGVIRGAGMLSISTVACTFVYATKRDGPVRTDFEPLQNELDQANGEVSRRVISYILNETASGWIARLIVLGVSPIRLMSIAAKAVRVERFKGIPVDRNLPRMATA